MIEEEEDENRCDEEVGACLQAGEPERALHFVAPRLGIDSTTSLFSRHVQDVL